MYLPPRQANVLARLADVRCVPTFKGRFRYELDGVDRSYQVIGLQVRRLVRVGMDGSLKDSQSALATA
jgi:hypothetical protein